MDMLNSECNDDSDDDLCDGRHDDCDCKSDDKFNWVIALSFSSDSFHLHGFLELFCEGKKNILLSKES